MSKPLASLSLDLDNKWSYLKTHGDAGWESYPSYLDRVVPRVLDVLAARRLTITFFVVGQDAALEANRTALRSIADAGHEIGNHSFRHEPWLHLYCPQELADELDRAEEADRRGDGLPACWLSRPRIQLLARGPRRAGPTRVRLRRLDVPDVSRSRGTVLLLLEHQPLARAASRAETAVRQIH